MPVTATTHQTTTNTHTYTATTHPHMYNGSLLVSVSNGSLSSECTSFSIDSATLSSVYGLPSVCFSSFLSDSSFLTSSINVGMELIIMVTLIIGFFLSFLILLPRFIKSDQTKKVHSDADSKVSKAYSKADVSLHNKRTDCWIIIKEKVYDVTPYVEEHPGGDAILAHAGDDSTEGFFG
ncbi:hypothetical protein M8C21_022182 [Ambrosia artemisiifolia]|uniref:Cytochrome b5 heme-binding domain-containing protein n=1 Tax=Ambrosia artemisiifolia TaxID=4212 RepID=A0AAD5GXG6_AMBAR|nr:hypothetical protein M8C21_022182 [Ambrosia artemisiifolia]